MGATPMSLVESNRSGLRTMYVRPGTKIYIEVFVGFAKSPTATQAFFVHRSCLDMIESRCDDFPGTNKGGFYAF